MINRPVTLMLVLLVLITADIFYVAHGSHDAEQIRLEQKAIEHQAMIERECGLAFPLKGESRDKCVQAESVLKAQKPSGAE